jgi:L-cysteine/cystine lyase
MSSDENPVALMRRLFPVLDRIAYLNTGTFGPLARKTVDVMAAQALRELEEGRSGAPYFDELLAARKELREQFARLLGTSADHIAVTSSTTDGCNIVLSGLDLAAEDEVVTTDAEHFGLAGPLYASGATIRVARVGTSFGERLLDAIVEEVTPRTRLLAVSHVLWMTGAVIDVLELKRRTGLPLLVDGAQSIGAMPVDVSALDFYTVSGQKWLCGPDSTGALYVAEPELLRVARPSFFSQESFEPGGRFRPQPGARRFDPGPVSLTGILGLRSALMLAPDWRYERIREISELCRDGLAERVHVITAPRQAGLVTFAPGGDPQQVAARLFQQEVVVRSLPGTPWVRASCGWWSDETDIDRLCSGI